MNYTQAQIDRTNAVRFSPHTGRDANQKRTRIPLERT